MKTILKKFLHGNSIWCTILIFSFVFLSCSDSDDDCSSDTQPESEISSQFLSVKDGKAQPIVESSKFAANFEAEKIVQSEGILRFCVYVETDYDTDGDGYLDLLKTYVQIPSVVLSNSSYKAGTIFYGIPYSGGINKKGDPSYKEHTPSSSSISSLESVITNTPSHIRNPSSSITTKEHAANAKSIDWTYQAKLAAEQPDDFSNNSYYYTVFGNYYLVRGFAYVTAAGLGTYGSEGIELCGTKYEKEAFASVIKWLNGEAKAYTDKTGTVEISASEWSNGNVGMMGCSYGGAIAFAVATTGVRGLKCIVPESGVANWYDYCYSQGICINSNTDYQNLLGWLCFSRFFDTEDFNSIKSRQEELYGFMSQEQKKCKGTFTGIFTQLDYTSEDNISNIKVPALIVAGLNDENVTNKHVLDMYSALQKAGQTESKIILHQDGHNSPRGLLIKGEPYEEILNKWFSHYLYGISNDVTSRPAVLVQHSYDQGWDSYTELNWETPASYKEFQVKVSETVPETQTVKSKVSKTIAESDKKQETNTYVTYAFEVPEDILIDGLVKVDLSLSTEVITPNDKGSYMFSACLFDSSTTPFWSYTIPKESTILDQSPVTVGGLSQGFGYTDSDTYNLQMSKVTQKIIAQGWLNLSMNGSDYKANSCTDLEPLSSGTNASRNYTLYMYPNVYKLRKGHFLQLVLMGFDFKMGAVAPSVSMRQVVKELAESDPVNYMFASNASASASGAADAEFEYQVTIDSAKIKLSLPTR